MGGSTFGKILRLTTFGESHGKAIGGILDGFPAGVEIDKEFIQQEMSRRRPGQSKLVSPRNEKDEVELLSGVFENTSLGTPIGFVVWNKDHHSQDYGHLKETFRPSHADYTFDEKYGIRDFRGGGRASARETVSRVVGGAFAKLLLNHFNITIQAFVHTIGTVGISESYSLIDLTKTEDSPVRCPDSDTSAKMIQLIEETAKEGNTLGGLIQCVVKNMPTGLGEPVFDKLHADLGKAMLSINAVKGFEIGSGFNAVSMKGSDHNDKFIFTDGKISTKTNYSGGIQGGLSNGNDIYFNTAFKPVATIMQDQKSVDKEGNAITIKGKGRHDVCVVPRAVPIVEAMAALVIADHLLMNRSSKL